MKYSVKISTSAFIKYTILLLYHVSINKDCHAKLTNKHVLMSSKAFAQCFLQLDNSIVVIGNFNDRLFHDFPIKSQDITVRLLGLQKIQSIKILPEKTVYKTRESDFENPVLPANNILISNLSVAAIKHVMLNLKYSIFWDLYARYVLDETWHRDSCSNVYEYFKVLWEFEIHNVVFMCRDVDQEIYFYIFNPFSEKVLNGWIVHQRVLQKNGHPMTIFRRIYDRFQGPSSLCEPAAFFDKTKSLGGYPIRIMELIVPVGNIPYELHEYGVQVSGTIVDSIWYSLNASLLKSYFPSSQRGGIDKAGYPLGLLEFLLQGDFDMQLNLDYERDFWRNQVYTYLESGICYLAWKDTHGEEKTFSSRFSIEIWMLLLFIAFVLILVFQLLLKVSYAQVAVNLLRGILGVAMFYEPKRPLDRAIFYVFIYNFIVLNSAFQSKLSSLLTAPMLKETIQAPLDLIRYRYRVLAEQRFEQYLYDTEFQNYTKRIDNAKFCLNKMLKDRKTACVTDCWAGAVLVVGNDFMQLVEDEELPKYFVHLFKDNFCLRSIYRRTYERLYQSGIVKYLQKVKIRVASLRYQLNSEETRGIKLSQIDFAFYFLLYGLLGAGLTFFTEIAIHQFSLKKTFKTIKAIFKKFIGSIKTFSSFS